MSLDRAEDGKRGSGESAAGVDGTDRVFEVQLSREKFATVLRFDSVETMQEHLRLFNLKPSQIWLWFPRQPIEETKG